MYGMIKTATIFKYFNITTKFSFIIDIIFTNSNGGAMVVVIAW